MAKNTIILGDVHGSFDGLVNTLMAAGAIDRDGNKNPDWRVVQLGDLCNMAPKGKSFRGFVSEDLETLAFGATVIDDLLVGNHEVFYTHGLLIGMWDGMGNPALGEFDDDLIPYMRRLVNQGKFVAATEVDGMLVTHAGLHPWLAKKEFSDDPAEVAVELNDQLIAAAMGQYNRFKAITDYTYSIFWMRPQIKHLPDGWWKYGQKTPYTQVVGHTPRFEHPRFIEDRNLWLIDRGAYTFPEYPSIGALVKREGETEFSVFETFNYQLDRATA